MRKVVGNLGWLLGSRGINAALSLVYLALATRSLGLTGFGQFTLIVVMAQTIAGVASFSTWQGIVRWGQSEAERRGAIGFALALDATSIAAGIPLAMLAAWFAPVWLPLPSDLRGAALGLCLVAVISLRSTPTGILRLHDRYGWGTAAEATLPIVRAAGAVAAWFLKPDVVGFVIAWGTAEVICAAVHWGLASRLTQFSWSDVSLRQLPQRYPDAWRFVLATNASRTLAVATRQILVLTVGAFGGAAMAGGYRVAAQFGQALVQLAEAISRALYPELVRSREKAADLVRQTIMLGASVGLAAAALAAVLGEWLLIALFGADFASVRIAMVLLVLAGAAELVATGYDALLVSRGRAGAVFLARAVPLVGALVLVPPAIERLGLSGPALSMLAASSMSAAVLGYLVFAANRTGRFVRR